MKLLRILVFLSFAMAFQPQTKQELQTAVDLWVTDEATALETYGEINEWDTSLITDMSALFYDETWNNFYSDFNSDISSWDVSNVTNMSYMFRDADIFNQDLSSWNVSSVIEMSYMFRDAASFNGNISSWNVSNLSLIHISEPTRPY